MRTILSALTLAGLSAAVGSAADATAGKAVYDKSCKTCHGADGTANPAIAKMMKVDMKDLSSAEVQAMSDDDTAPIGVHLPEDLPRAPSRHTHQLDSIPSIDFI